MRIATYNIRLMTGMFDGNRIKPECLERAQCIADVIRRIDPTILGVCEGPRYGSQFEAFLTEYLPELGMRTVHARSRGYENLILAYRAPLEVISVDADIGFYGPWLADPDKNGITKKFWWYKQPLDVVFRHAENGIKFLVIQVHGPTKGILNPVTFLEYQKLSVAKRIQMVAEAERLRIRVRQLLQAEHSMPFLIQGDMNDDPDLDESERYLGHDYVRTLMGDVFSPREILHNTLAYEWLDPELKPDLWTCTYMDPIVLAAFNQLHKVWIDHQLLSPSMVDSSQIPRLLPRSGRVDTKDEIAKKASDHFAVWSDFTFQALA